MPLRLLFLFCFVLVFSARANAQEFGIGMSYDDVQGLLKAHPMWCYAWEESKPVQQPVSTTKAKGKGKNVEVAVKASAMHSSMLQPCDSVIRNGVTGKLTLDFMGSSNIMRITWLENQNYTEPAYEYYMKAFRLFSDEYTLDYGTPETVAHEDEDLLVRRWKTPKSILLLTCNPRLRLLKTEEVAY